MDDKNFNESLAEGKVKLSISPVSGMEQALPLVEEGTIIVRVTASPLPFLPQYTFKAPYEGTSC